MFVAHTRTIDNKTQSIEEHLQNTALLCSGYADVFGWSKQAYQVGEFHDLGKFSSEFQKRVRGECGPVDHSSAGAFLLYKNRQIIEAMCIAGHHSGLLDFGTKYDAESSTFCSRMSKWKSRENECSQYLQLLGKPIIPYELPKMNYTEAQFRTRMLFSCLVDADYLDTETFSQGYQREIGFDSLESIIDDIERKARTYLAVSSSDVIKRLRNEFLRFSIEAGKGKPGFYKLALPTGGGKTFASLAYAAEHIKRNPELRRIIYVVPYTSIIEQTAKAFRQIVGERNVLEHHSCVDFEGDYEDGSLGQRLKLSTENWDAPIIVTTSEQFFESLYSNRPGKCRKLHNIACSVVILDEVQTLPIHVLKPCMAALNELVQSYGVTCVYCSATQPALDQFFSNETAIDIVPYKQAQWDAFERTEIKVLKNPLSFVDAAALACLESEVLIIVNTKASAAALFKLLPEEGRIYLTTNLTPSHRKRILESIKSLLSAGKTCRVIATSLVEAGVDLDFPCVFREINGLDSIIQAAGRCNREGKRKASESTVRVISLESGKIPQPEVQRKICILKELCLGDRILCTADVITRYFNAYYDLEDELDKHGILNENKAMDFEWLNDNFKMIESDTCSVLVADDAIGKSMIDQFQRGVFPAQGWPQVALHCVSVYPQRYQELRNQRAMIQISPGFGVLVDDRYYNPSTGLSESLIQQGDAVFA